MPPTQGDGSLEIRAGFTAQGKERGRALAEP